MPVVQDNERDETKHFFGAWPRWTMFVANGRQQSDKAWNEWRGRHDKNSPTDRMQLFVIKLFL